MHDLVVHNGDSLAEELWSEVNFLNYVACVEPDFPERGLSLEAGALVEKSIVVDSPWVKAFGSWGNVLMILNVYSAAAGGRVRRGDSA